MEDHHLYKWPFSTAMFVITRGKYPNMRLQAEVSFRPRAFQMQSGQVDCSRVGKKQKNTTLKRENDDRKSMDCRKL